MPRKLLALGISALVILAACGSDGDGASGGATTTSTGVSTTTATAATTAPPVSSAPTTVAGAFPVTIETEAGVVTVDEEPSRIVSLSPTATEMLFAIGAGDQVVAVDEQSSYPVEAPRTSLSGYPPNLEAIVAYEPDLVVVESGGEVVDALAATHVPVLVHPAAKVLEDSYRQLEQLGAATGHRAESAEVVAGMRTGIESLQAEVSEREAPLRYFHELDPTLFTATSSTFIGEVYKLAGLENIADGADDGTGYPQLSSEYLVQQDPDLIFLADVKCCQQGPDTVAARPGWAVLSAVQQGGVVSLDDDVASRWGPRVVDFLRAVVDATALVPAGT